MKTIKRTLVWLGLMLAVCNPWAASGAEWMTDLNAAQARAQREQKAVLLDFTGSDWCGWCMKLKGEVFDQPEFENYARANLILVEVDFPRHKSQSPEQKQANQLLAHRYGVRGYPTVVMLDSNGRRIGDTGYCEGGPKAFISNLDRMPGMYARHAAPAPHAHAPELPTAVPSVPTHYDELALKAISGPANRRMALINNETFLAGESAKVKVKDTKIEVTCKEIRNDSVLVTVDGKNVELLLRQH